MQKFVLRGTKKSWVGLRLLIGTVKSYSYYSLPVKTFASTSGALGPHFVGFCHCGVDCVMSNHTFDRLPLESMNLILTQKIRSNCQHRIALIGVS